MEDGVSTEVVSPSSEDSGGSSCKELMVLRVVSHLSVPHGAVRSRSSAHRSSSGTGGSSRSGRSGLNPAQKVVRLLEMICADVLTTGFSMICSIASFCVAGGVSWARLPDVQGTGGEGERPHR